MWQKLENLRGKDEATRRMAAICVSAAVTLIIAGVWATVFFRGSAGEIVSAPSSIASDIAAKGVESVEKSPIGAFSESTSRVWQSLVEQFSQLKASVESLENATSTSENVI